MGQTGNSDRVNSSSPASALHRFEVSKIALTQPIERAYILNNWHALKGLARQFCHQPGLWGASDAQSAVTFAGLIVVVLGALGAVLADVPVKSPPLASISDLSLASISARN
jgi:hypothetical protein